MAWDWTRSLSLSPVVRRFLLSRPSTCDVLRFLDQSRGGGAATALSCMRLLFYSCGGSSEAPSDTLLVLRPAAPVCVDLDRRWLFVSDTPNNRIVMASLDSGEIQGTVCQRATLPSTGRGHLTWVLNRSPPAQFVAMCCLLAGIPYSALPGGLLLCGIQIGCGVPGVADGTWESAEFSHPAGLLLDAEANALYVADRKARDYPHAQHSIDAVLRWCAWARWALAGAPCCLRILYCAILYCTSRWCRASMHLPQCTLLSVCLPFPPAWLHDRPLELQGRAVRRVSLDERHDDQRGGHQVVTVHPPPAPPAPRPTFLQRTWHHVMYLLFLTEPPPNTDVIPAATTYYTRPGISGEGHPGAGKRGAEGSSTGGYGGDELEPWRLAWGPQGKDTLLVTNQGCTRAWSLHLPSLEVSPVDVSQWSSSLPEPASGGSASFAHYFDAAERAATSADGFTYSISEAGNVAVEPSGVQAQEKPSLAAADSPASGTGPRASSGAAEGGPRILRLSNLAALGVPPMWKVPAEPMSLFRYRELSPRSETSDSATALGTPGRGGREGTLASEPEGSGVGTPASHRPASTGVGSVFRFAAVVGQGRHRGVLRVGVPAGWQLEELPDTATAWVQCRGSAVELSVLGGQLEGSRVSWAQEWRDQLEADRWMEAVGEDQEAQNLPLDPRHEGAPTLADGVGNRTDGPARLGGLGGENAGGDGRGSNVQGASAEHASGAAAGYSGVRGAPSEEMSPASSVDEACIGFFLDASPGQAQVRLSISLWKYCLSWNSSYRWRVH